MEMTVVLDIAYRPPVNHEAMHTGRLIYDPFIDHSQFAQLSR
jgi:hypothetical protein